MVGRYHPLDRHEFEQTPGDSEGQGSLACCGPWGRKESEMTCSVGATEQQQQQHNLLTQDSESGLGT